MYLQQPDTLILDTLHIPKNFRDRRGDDFMLPSSSSPFFLSLPGNIKKNFPLDSSGSFYQIDENIGNSFDFRPKSKIYFEDMKKYTFDENISEGWKSISKAQDISQDNTKKASDRLVPLIYLGPNANKIFGSNFIDIRPNGRVVLDFALQTQRTYNPQIPILQQKTTNFLFDQQIRLNLMGKIGTKLTLNTDFNTKQVFDFQQLYNIDFKNYDEFIIQDFNFGNITFQTENHLMGDLQNLFGFSPKFRFGKLFLEVIYATQRGRLQTIQLKNGSQVKEINIRGSDYQTNRHFFIGHLFRDLYESSLSTLPLVSSPVMITRIEVYVTNRNNNTKDLRNICAFMDLGEAKPYNISITASNAQAMDNTSNNLYDLIKNDPSLRSPDNIESQLNTLPFTLNRGTDYEVLVGARKLNAEEFTFQPQLGYISLKTPLKNDEILCVSFEYSYQGRAYKVGEMTEDYQKRGDRDVIFLKMLSPSTLRTDLPMWDLMMKNVYATGNIQIQKENFQLRVIYRDDLTGIDNSNLQEGVNFENIPLIRVLGVDKLNVNGDVQSDGNYDFIENITILQNTGEIIFPVLEPFGSTLERNFTITEKELANKYVYNDLYEKTQADAQLNTQKNKFYIMGNLTSMFSNEIQLPGINIAKNSVVIYSGGLRLREDVDYVVDYQFGKIKIINNGLLNSEKPLRIEYENSDLFNYQTRQLFGFKAKYQFNKNFDVSSSLMYLLERPVLSRIRIGEEPVKNVMIGFGSKYFTESQLLTRIIDKIPFLSTKAVSSIELQAAVSALIPGVPKLVGTSGNYYIDDFEGSEIGYNLSGTGRSRWSLGSIPLRIIEENSTTLGMINSNFRRAKMAWYTIDNIFYNVNGVVRRPSNLTQEDMNNHYVRSIRFNEVFPNRQRGQLIFNESSFDIAFYPKERGPYNYVTDIESNGSLKNPEKNFGSIISPILFNIDFDNINIQYLEFWLMDPFLEGENGKIEGENNTTGGDLYISLGSISEDVIPDSRHYFENGMQPALDSYRESDWGRTPITQYLTNSFSPEVPRTQQDIGLDGLDNNNERDFFRQSFLNNLPLSAGLLGELENDPSGDDFKHYLDESYTTQNVKLLERYKNFNGTQGNSAQNSNANYVFSATNFPDNEDLNRDNTLSQLNQYYDYPVRLWKGMDTNSHKYIVDKVESTDPNTNEKVTWYQFRIPIRDPSVENINNISGFKSIRFIRYYLTGWRQPVVLRFVSPQFTSSQWRPYTQSLLEPGLNVNEEQTATGFTVSTVNIEENGQGDANNIPYNLPPGFSRDFDRTSPVNRQLNEQALKFCVDNLSSSDARAIFKNFNLSLVNYGSIKMEIHAESRDAQDGELRAFLRIGTDPDRNYYEIEVPLKLTPFGTTAGDRQALWPRENAIDIALSDLILVKKERDMENTSLELPYSKELHSKYKITVVGRPDLTSAQVVLLGIRNPKNTFNNHRSACVWFNELRVSDFDNSMGWATEVSLTTNLADVASVNTSVRYVSPGFGNIQTKLSDRKRYELIDYGISSNINLHKFLFHKVGLKIPLYISYERSIHRPNYNTQDKDVARDIVLATLSDNTQEKEIFLDKIESVAVRRSISLNNMRKEKTKPNAKTYPWDIENLSLNATYLDETRKDSLTEYYQRQKWNINPIYRHNFKKIEFTPFSKIKGLNSTFLKLIKDFNFSLLPNSIGFSANLERGFIKTKLRTKENSSSDMIPFFEKYYRLHRRFNFSWQLTKSVNLSYNNQGYSIIDEPLGDINTQVKRDSIKSNFLKGGRLKLMRQSLDISYQVPFNKFPITQFINTQLRHRSNYDWGASALNLVGVDNLPIGHRLQINKSFDVTGSIELTQVYKSLGLLSLLEERPKNYVPLKKKIDRLEEKVNKLYDRESNLKKGNRDLLEKNILKKERMEEEIQKVEAKINKYNNKLLLLREKQKELLNSKSKPSLGIKSLFHILLFLKNISFSYSNSLNSLLPGIDKVPTFFDFSSKWYVPVVPFSQNEPESLLRTEAIKNTWLTKSESQNQLFIQSFTRTYKVSVNIEPIKSLQITVSFEKSKTNNYSEILRYNKAEDQFQSNSPNRKGSYKISYMPISTAFLTDGIYNRSVSFEKFVANRAIIKSRLTELNTNEGVYDLNSQDVLIPAFMAAYTDVSADNVTLDKFPTLPFPNWQLRYNLPILKKIFSSFSLTHGYQSNYQIGNYSSSLQYLSDPEIFYLFVDENNMPYPTSFDETRLFVPILLLDHLLITERFSPLIGLNFNTVNSMQFQISYSTSRNIALNLINAQITEIKNQDINAQFGYTVQNLKLPFRIRGLYRRLPNEVGFNIAFTFRDNKTIQRKIVDTNTQNTVTAGNFSMLLRPNITYKINKYIDLMFYFEYNFNEPYVSNAYKRVVSRGGFQLIFSITE